jgi:hypothetical protein
VGRGAAAAAAAAAGVRVLLMSRGRGGGASAGSLSAAGRLDWIVPAAFLAAFATFLAGAGAASGSSGWTARRSPSASALRRTRSAWASSIDDE